MFGFLKGKKIKEAIAGIVAVASSSVTILSASSTGNISTDATFDDGAMIGAALTGIVHFLMNQRKKKGDD